MPDELPVFAELGEAVHALEALHERLRVYFPAVNLHQGAFVCSHDVALGIECPSCRDELYEKSESGPLRVVDPAGQDRGLQPVEMEPAEIAAVLRDMAARLEDGSSFEGSIEYLLPDPPELSAEPGEALPEVRDTRLVRGVYRTGNDMGQGGVRMIGEVAGATA